MLLNMNKISPIPALNDNYIWMIVHPEQRTAVIVDPGDAQPVLETLRTQQLQLAAILITHHHWDHTNGIDAILAEYPVPVYGPADDPVPQVTHPLQQGNRFRIDAIEEDFIVLSIPGHTLGHIAYVTEDHCLFCGDTLFLAGCGRLFEGTAEQMHHSLQAITELPNDTMVYCAHEYTQANLQFAKAVDPDNSIIDRRIENVNRLRKHNQPTIPGELFLELETNPFLRCHAPSVIAAAEAHCGTTLNNPVEVFATLRKWKDSY